MIIVQEDDWKNDAVTISVDEYIKLLEEVKFLRYMENYGVENWEGYELAIEAWRNSE